MSLRIVATGGTFDKHYDELTGNLVFAASNLPALVKRARLTLPTEVEALPPLDSLDMQDADRERILEACRAAPEPAIVVVHGTDTMRETAAVLGPIFGADAIDKIARTIVITGAMIPYQIADSDAFFNLGFACAAAQTLKPGVYIAMNGQVFDWNKVQKNRVAGVFERT